MALRRTFRSCAAAVEVMAAEAWLIERRRIPINWRAAADVAELIGCVRATLPIAAGHPGRAARRRSWSLLVLTDDWRRTRGAGAARPRRRVPNGSSRPSPIPSCAAVLSTLARPPPLPGPSSTKPTSSPNCVTRSDKTTRPKPSADSLHKSRLTIRTSWSRHGEPGSL
jgi:hypothetical protein